MIHLKVGDYEWKANIYEHNTEQLNISAVIEHLCFSAREKKTPAFLKTVVGYERL